MESFNHNYSVDQLKKLNKKKINTLELGAGLGTQIEYEDLSFQNYYCTEIRTNIYNALKKKYPNVNVVQCDIQKKMPFEDNFFDRVNVIHVLEHLPNLPSCIEEVYRCLKKGGIFQIVMPCDPGFLYKMCRKVSSERLMRKHFNVDYDWFINREHINSPDEILYFVNKKFKPLNKKFFPFLIPSVNLNICIGLTVIKE